MPTPEACTSAAMQKRGLKELADSLTAVIKTLNDLPHYHDIEGRKLEYWTDGMNFEEWVANWGMAKNYSERLLGLVQKWAKFDNINLTDAPVVAAQEETDGA